jgi:hypothetical protein
MLLLLLLFLLLLLLLLLTANGFIPSGSVLKCKTGQYNTVQDNTMQYNTIVQHTSNRITHIAPVNIHHSRKPSIRKIKRKKSGTHIIHYSNSETSTT